MKNVTLLKDDLKKLYYTEVNKSPTLAADFKETEL